MSVMAKLDYEATRAAWLQNASAEARLWLEHIDEKAAQITTRQSQGQLSIFEEGELLFNISALLNWLAHIDLREAKTVSEIGHPKGKDMISWLGNVTSWPPEVCEAFWFCVRNPVMHTGRSFVFCGLRPEDQKPPEAARRSPSEYEFRPDGIPTSRVQANRT